MVVHTFNPAFRRQDGSEFVASLVYAKKSKPELHIETLSPTKTNQDKTKQKANHNQTFFFYLVFSRQGFSM